MTEIFVFDTNSLISAYLLPHSISRKALDKALNTGIIAYSKNGLDELIQTFVRPKFDRYISVEKRLAAIEEFSKNSQLVNVTISINECRDEKDNKFLELAVEANATCIITGDKDLLTLNPFRNTHILTAAEFIERYGTD